MKRLIAVPVTLWVAAGAFVGESLLVALLPPFRAWEPGVALLSVFVAYWMLRRSRIAWGIALLGGIAQLGAGAAQQSALLALAGAALLVCLLSSPVRSYVFDRPVPLVPSASPGPEASLVRRLLLSPMQLSLELEELVARVDRRLVIRGCIAVVGLFFLVSVVGSWHSKIRRSTPTTDTIWTIVTTTYKVALVALVLLLVMAVVGSAVRKRQQP
jgi:hypothetical protein